MTKAYLLQMDLTPNQGGVVSFAFADAGTIAQHAKLATKRGARYHVYDINVLGSVEPIICTTNHELGEFRITGSKKDGSIEFTLSIPDSEPDYQKAV